MATRSDVVVAVKTQHVKAFREKLPTSLKLSEPFESDEGTLFSEEDVIWDLSDEGEVEAFYAWLDSSGIPKDDYLVLEACHDYPDSDDGHRGRWIYNPWKIQKHLSVSLSFKEAPPTLDSCYDD